MKYTPKSVIIGRKKRDEELKEKDDESRPCFIALFDENNPHTKGTAPKEILDFDEVHKIVIKNLKELNYLLAGNDILINNILEVEINAKEGHLIVDVKQ